MDIQSFIDGINYARRLERASSQITLGDMISQLEKLPQESMIESLINPHSYRGYYDDLALTSNQVNTSVNNQLEIFKSCLDQVFEGYKGGDFKMDKNTPLWVGNYGSPHGSKIVGLNTLTNPISYILEEDSD